MNHRYNSRTPNPNDMHNERPRSMTGFEESGIEQYDEKISKFSMLNETEQPRHRDRDRDGRYYPRK